MKNLIAFWIKKHIRGTCLGIAVLCVILSACFIGKKILLKFDSRTDEKINGNQQQQEQLIDEYASIGSYDLVKQYETAGGKWYSETDDIYDYAWTQCLNVWNSYIVLYETSKDLYWIEKLSKQIDEILNKRDSLIGIYDRKGFSLASWSYTSDFELYMPYHDPVMIGLIVYPILRFVEAVINNNLEQFYPKAKECLQASLNALSVLDKDVNKYNGEEIPKEACEDLWRERQTEEGIFGYYVGHSYYEEEYFYKRGFVSENPLPYNQSLSVAQCYPVLYRILGDELWREKSEKSWKWFSTTALQKEGDMCWWYYSEYYNWCRTNAVPVDEIEPPLDGSNYYEDYEGHYSIDLMFIIEAHKIGIIDNDELLLISLNKKNMGLSDDGWPKVMNINSQGSYNLKAAVYFDYFVNIFQDYEYLDIIYPILKDELQKQQKKELFANNSTGINGTCLRLLTSAYVVELFLR